jgi:hypothetical protein
MRPLLVTWTQLPGQEQYLHRVLTHFVHLRLLPSQGFRHLLAIVSPYNPWTRGSFRAHLRPYKFSMDLQIRALHLFHIQAMSLTHTHTHMHTSTPFSEPERHGFTLDRTTWVSGLEVIKLSFCLLKAGLLFEPRFLSV